MTSPCPFAEVIGDPIEHSKSPLIHGYWLEKLGLPAEYRRNRVSQEELPAFIAARRLDPHWRGCNVTMPLKLEALMLAEERSDAAVQAGACNLVVPRGGKLLAANTDVGAVMLVVERLAQHRKTGAVTLLGTGGAARAVLVALTRMGLREIIVQGRNEGEAINLANRFDLSLAPRPLDAPVETDGLVNSTPLGMTGSPPLEIDLSAMPRHGWVFDLVSAPAPTALVLKAEEQGLAISGGLAMLVEQAAASFPHLFGEDPPRDRLSDAELYRRLAE
jgi:shikimate dehydrogenase